MEENIVAWEWNSLIAAVMEDEARFHTLIETVVERLWPEPDHFQNKVHKALQFIENSVMAAIEATEKAETPLEAK